MDMSVRHRFSGGVDVPVSAKEDGELRTHKHRTSRQDQENAQLKGRSHMMPVEVRTTPRWRAPLPVHETYEQKENSISKVIGMTFGDRQSTAGTSQVDVPVVSDGASVCMLVGLCGNPATDDGPKPAVRLDHVVPSNTQAPEILGEQIDKMLDKGLDVGIALVGGEAGPSDAMYESLRDVVKARQARYPGRVSIEIDRVTVTKKDAGSPAPEGAPAQDEGKARPKVPATLLGVVNTRQLNPQAPMSEKPRARFFTHRVREASAEPDHVVVSAAQMQRALAEVERLRAEAAPQDDAEGGVYL